MNSKMKSRGSGTRHIHIFVCTGFDVMRGPRFTDTSIDLLLQLQYWKNPESFVALLICSLLTGVIGSWWTIALIRLSLIMN